MIDCKVFNSCGMTRYNQTDPNSQKSLRSWPAKSPDHFFLFLKKKLINFCLRWVFVVARRLSLVAVSRGYSLLPCAGFSLRWLLLQSMDSRCAGFSSCGTRAQQLWLMGSRVQAQQLQRMGFVAPRHVGSSRTRARTCVPCIGRRILNHCTIREALPFLNFSFGDKVKLSGTTANSCNLDSNQSLVFFFFFFNQFTLFIFFSE